MKELKPKYLVGIMIVVIGLITMILDTQKLLNLSLFFHDEIQFNVKEIATKELELYKYKTGFIGSTLYEVTVKNNGRSAWSSAWFILRVPNQQYEKKGFILRTCEQCPQNMICGWQGSCHPQYNTFYVEYVCVNNKCYADCGLNKCAVQTLDPNVGKIVRLVEGDVVFEINTDGYPIFRTTREVLPGESISFIIEVAPYKNAEFILQGGFWAGSVLAIKSVPLTQKTETTTFYIALFIIIVGLILMFL